jgi:NAD(P)-dependent dehydrogenase (short-subunit alcohol dehydrogenase family)
MRQPLERPLAGRRALVTGAGRRLGREIAIALARSGCDVIVHYRRSRDDALSVVAEIQDMGVEATAVQVDLADETAVGGMLDTSWETIGPIDFLVNSASMFGESRLRSVDMDDVILNLRINAWAPLVLIRHLAAWVEKAGRRAAVVNLLDTRIAGEDREHAAYHLSKRALADLTRMTAVEYAPTLRVNGVAPGAILPPEQHGDAYLEARAAAAPMRRPGTTEDVTGAVLYLLMAPFVTGEIVFVDGGQNLRPEA